MGRRPRSSARARPALDAAAPDPHRGPRPRPTVTSPAPSSSSAAARSTRRTIPSTVYRTLDVLEELGLLSHSHAADGREEFHVLPAAVHGHLHCIGLPARPGRSRPTRRPGWSSRWSSGAASRWTSPTCRSPGDAPIARRLSRRWPARKRGRMGELTAIARPSREARPAERSCLGPGRNRSGTIRVRHGSRPCRNACGSSSTARSWPTRRTGSGCSRPPGRPSTTSRRRMSGWTGWRPVRTSRSASGRATRRTTRRRRATRRSRTWPGPTRTRSPATRRSVTTSRSTRGRVDEAWVGDERATPAAGPVLRRLGHLADRRPDQGRARLVRLVGGRRRQSPVGTPRMLKPPST